MKIAYLILGHDTPRVLSRAIPMLSTEDCAFFVHIDQKSSMAEFSGIRGGNVHFSPERMPVFWAEFSGVQATLDLLREALASPQTPDYCVLLSASAYPLRNGPYIQQFLTRNMGSEFMSLVKVPAPGKPLSRINTRRFSSSKPALHFAGKILARLGLAKRDYRTYLPGLEAYAGNTWWALTRDAGRYILEFTDRNPHVGKYFENVFAPDEAFFHTILGNSSFRPKIRRNLVYEDWSAQGAHPAMITEQHVAVFEKQNEVRVNDVFGEGESLFARKFCDSNLGVLQRIDEMIERKERSPRCS
jgi:hypothetical protein